MPTTIPDHLPAKLTISLWDFTWYTQTAEGEPFADLDAAFLQARERGYNTVRICAAPLLLFGEHGIDTSALRFEAVGGGTGQRTRWYDAKGGETLDLRAHLLELFAAAQRHGMVIIVSSWEYQQSPAFLDNPSWHEMLQAIPPAERFSALARSIGRLVDLVQEHGYGEQIAYVELHNEVDLSKLREVAPNAADTFRAQRPYLEAALDELQSSNPDVLSTVCYGIPPHLDLGAVPDNAQVAHQHFYIYGVLGALERWADVRGTPPAFPTPELKSLLREDAPGFDDWQASVPQWRLDATGISPSMFYTYDWVDPARWDAWLYRNYHEHAQAMRQGLDDRLTAVAKWAELHDVPAVIGEGWIGYTPLEADFEDGPIGQEIAAEAVRRCGELGYWGTLPGSNSAPHHPGWGNVRFQQRVNRGFLAS